MEGRTGKIKKGDGKNLYIQKIKKKTEKLKKKDNIKAKDIEEQLIPLFKEIITQLKINQDQEIVSKVKDKLERLENSYETIDVHEEIDEFIQSFQELEITTNLDKIAKNPFLTIYKEDGEEIKTWRQAITTQLPEDIYKVECIAGNQKKTQKIELTKNKNIEFQFNVEKLKKEKKDSTQKTEDRERGDEDFIKAGQKQRKYQVNDHRKTETTKNTKNKSARQKSLKISIKRKIRTLELAIKKIVKYAMRLILLAITAATIYYIYTIYV